MVRLFCDVCGEEIPSELDVWSRYEKRDVTAVLEDGRRFLVNLTVYADFEGSRIHPAVFCSAQCAVQVAREAFTTPVVQQSA